jgi:hypothetical protein
MVFTKIIRVPANLVAVCAYFIRTSVDFFSVLANLVTVCVRRLYSMCLAINSNYKNLAMPPRKILLRLEGVVLRSCLRSRGQGNNNLHFFWLSHVEKPVFGRFDFTYINHFISI